MRKLIMMVVLAATVTPAAAQPWQPTEGRRYDRQDRYGENYERYGRDRYTARDRHRWTRDFRGRWVPLARNYSAGTDRQFLNLYGQHGQIRHLRIEADRGRPVIQQVAIQDTRGNTQVVKLNERLLPGEGEVIRVNQDAPIQRIVVYTEPRAGGSYSIYGG